MPRLTQWCVRIALLNLLFGFTLGGMLLLAKSGLVDPLVWLWLPAHVDALIVGWMMQFAMGMAYWILPRRRVVGRGRPELAWAAFILLNVGLVISVGLSWLRYWLLEWVWLQRAFPLGLALQVLALLLFVGYAWQRVLPTITLPKSEIKL